DRRFKQSIADPTGRKIQMLRSAVPANDGADEIGAHSNESRKQYHEVTERLEQDAVFKGVSLFRLQARTIATKGRQIADSFASSAIRKAISATHICALRRSRK